MLLSSSVNKFDRPSGEIRHNLFKRWHHNLIGCLPRWIRRVLGTEQAELIIDTSGIHWQATLQRYATTLQRLKNLEDDLTKLKGILYRAHRLKAKIILLISEREVLIRVISFPTETPDRLRKTLTYTAISYELDRLTPFASQEIYHEFRFLSAPSNSSYLEIELAVARKAVIDENLRLLREVGGLVDVVSWPNSWSEANLLPFKQRRKIKNLGRKIRWVLGFMILALTTTLAISPLIQKRAIAIDLNEKFDKAKREAAKVNNLRTLIEQEQKTANFVLEQKLAANYTIDLLVRLTDLIPDTAWVNMLNYYNGQVDFSGEAQQASALIELLAKNPAFHNSTFRSPTTRTSSGIDRFHIQFDYVGVGAGN